MGENGKPILTKIQDVMGIKSGKYCSSDVSVVSINGGGGKPEQSFGNKPESPTATIGIPSVTYTNCPERQSVIINYIDIQMNNNIIPDCVLGGSVILNDLNGYVVNYGETICPVPNIKDIQRCDGDVRSISIDFKDYVVTDGKVYDLSFNGMTQPGCYTIIGDSPFDTQDSVKSVDEKPDCNSCGPTPQTVIQIQSCENGSIYSVSSGSPFIRVGNILNLTFKYGTIPNGCYTIVGATLSISLDYIITTSDKYDSCIDCMA
jgi:hypothetical protein